MLLMINDRPHGMQKKVVLDESNWLANAGNQIYWSMIFDKIKPRNKFRMYSNKIVGYVPNVTLSIDVMLKLIKSSIEKHIV